MLMLDPVKMDLPKAEARLKEAVSPFDLAGLRAKIDSMNKQSEQSNFWDDPEKAQSLLKKKRHSRAP